MVLINFPSAHASRGNSKLALRALLNLFFLCLMLPWPEAFRIVFCRSFSTSQCLPQDEHHRTIITHFCTFFCTIFKLLSPYFANFSDLQTKASSEHRNDPNGLEHSWKNETGNQNGIGHSTNSTSNHPPNHKMA